MPGGRRWRLIVVVSPALTRAGAAGLALDGRDFAGLHLPLEAAQPLADLPLGALAQELGRQLAEPTGGGDVIDDDPYGRPAVAQRLVERDRAGVGHVRA